MTNLGLSYQDNSDTPFLGSFNSYTIDLMIKVDNEIVNSKSILIEESGQVINLDYNFFK